jgi:hypothetical protein
MGVGNACERSEQGVTEPNNDAGPLSPSLSPFLLEFALVHCCFLCYTIICDLYLYSI